jgi:hypothetical protein
VRAESEWPLARTRWTRLYFDPKDRPPEIFGGKVTLYAGGDQAAYVLLPVIPRGKAERRRFKWFFI